MARKRMTVVSFLLDETGSMDTVRDATISGFNEYVGSLKQRDAKVLFTLTLFNSAKLATVHNAVPVGNVPDLTRDSYRPTATTPLYDAIAQVIHDTENAAAAMKAKPDVLLVVLTDGLENASKEYSRTAIFDLIQRKEKDGWTFAYLGANQDAWAVAESIGVAGANSLTYDASAPQQAFSRLSKATDLYFAAAPSASRGFFSDQEPDGGDQKPKRRSKS